MGVWEILQKVGFITKQYHAIRTSNRVTTTISICTIRNRVPDLSLSMLKCQTKFNINPLTSGKIVSSSKSVNNLQTNVNKSVKRNVIFIFYVVMSNLNKSANVGPRTVMLT